MYIVSKDLSEVQKITIENEINNKFGLVMNNGSIDIPINVTYCDDITVSYELSMLLALSTNFGAVIQCSEQNIESEEKVTVYLNSTNSYCTFYSLSKYYGGVQTKHCASKFKIRTDKLKQMLYDLNSKQYIEAIENKRERYRESRRKFPKEMDF